METSSKKSIKPSWWRMIGKGLKEDVTRRFPYYLEDFTDGYKGENTLSKVFATTFFLYFAVLLPALATGVLNAIFTQDKIGVYQVLLSEIIGGFSWTFLSGQPLVIISNTLVVAFYNKVIHDLAADLEVDFFGLYACSGLWGSLFLILYSIFNLSDLMKHLKKSIKDIYTTFVVLAFVRSAIANIEKDVEEHSREETLFSILLMISTTWFALKICRIKTTSFFNQPIRDLISSYALPISILCITLVSNLFCQDMTLATFKYQPNNNTEFHYLDFTQLEPKTLLISIGLGFCLSLVFFMSQSITIAMVDCPENHLKKGSAYHWDLLVLALINGTLGILGLPFMHAIIPQSPLHAKGLSHTIQTEDGKIVITKVRETRLVNFLLHFFFAISLLFLPYVLPYCPIAVLSGLFLYLGHNAWIFTQFYQRIKLFITEKSAFPSYTSKVPLYVLHSFTLLQSIQLIILCFFGFISWPQVRMFFPLIVFLFFMLRLKILPLIFKQEYLDILDE